MYPELKPKSFHNYSGFQRKGVQNLRRKSQNTQVNTALL